MSVTSCNGWRNHIVAQSNFDKRLIIEQIRYLEAEKTLESDAESSSLPGSEQCKHHHFEDCLWQRATRLVQQHNLSLILSRASRLSRYLSIVTLLLVALLGVLGISYAVSDSHTINIYWLLLVLLAFNFISMLMWLVGINLNRSGMFAGMVNRLLTWLLAYLDNKSKATGKNEETSKNFRRQADLAWLKCQFSAQSGKWRLSKITHQLWLAYLLSGLVFLIVLLMLRQYDFVWGTTLLSDTVFIKITDWLSVPLQAVGFTTPSIEQIEQTRIGATQLLSDEHRYRWAQFLLGALLCFGIVPRVILWLVSTAMHGYARRHFTLDYYLPYYINLRQKLMPLASHGQIVDADISAPMDRTLINNDALDAITSNGFAPHALPLETLWVAVELGDKLIWPLASIQPEYDLGQVIDRESQTRVLQTLQDKTKSVVAVTVSAARPPDRGVQRIITGLMASSTERWLVLLQHHQDEEISRSRLADWYRLAESCEVPADHVISMSEDQS